jgi:glutaconate CoA-transferase subunit B
VRIVTDMGILEPSALDGELELVGLYPGVNADEVRSKTGWPLRSAPSVSVLPPPTNAELHLLRDVLDPDHLYIGKRDA